MPQAPRVGSGEGIGLPPPTIPLPTGERVWGGRCAPSPEIFLYFFENTIYRILTTLSDVYFLNHTPMGGVLTPLTPSSVRHCGIPCTRVHTVRPMIMISSPYGSPIILVSGDIKFIPKFEGDHPRARALNEGGVGTNWRFSTNKPPYLRNGARYDKGYY